MPIHKTKGKKDERRALCINCKDKVLTMPHSRFNLFTEEGIGDQGKITLLMGYCDSCGYAEFYLNGFLFKMEK